MKTKQYLPVGVFWDKVATVLDAGLTVKKSNKAFNDQQEMFNFFVSGFGMLLKQTNSYHFYYHCYFCHDYYYYYFQ